MERPPEDGAPGRLMSSPTWLTTQTAAHASRLVAEGMAAAGVRGYHYRVLASLVEFGPTSQVALGRRSGIHVSDLVVTVNELVDRDFVERSPDPANRRRNIVMITPAGERQLRWLDERMAQIQEEFVAPLSPAEREELKRLLTVLLDHHRRRSAAAGHDEGSDMHEPGRRLAPGEDGSAGAEQGRARPMPSVTTSPQAP
ncbi:MarR family winged helix-turn-helix transcriptional regulator [Geodermatophilus sp. SYSU D01176]